MLQLRDEDILTFLSGASREGGAAAPFALFFPTRLPQSLQTGSAPAFVYMKSIKLWEADAVGGA